MFPVYMISISENPVSQYYKDICKSTWSDFGYHVLDYEAVTPKTLHKYNEVKFAETKFSGNPFTETEKSVWHSHRELWKFVVKSCANGCIIIEHDCYMLKPLPDGGQRIGRNFFCNTAINRNRPRVSPCAGYFVTNTVASELVRVSAETTHEQNVDGFLYETCRQLGHIPSNLKINTKEYYEFFESGYSCIQYFDESVGRTIKHNE